MDFNNIIDLNSQVLGLNQISTVDIILRIFFSLFFGWIISFLFIKTDERNENGAYTYKVIIFCPAIIATSLMALGNSMSTAFGLFAALSIIRFRTPIKNVREMLFLFFSIAIGICMGVGFYKVAIVSIIMISCGLLLDHLYQVSKKHTGIYSLRMYVPAEKFSELQSDLEKILKEGFLKWDLVELRTTTSTITEINYRVVPKSLETAPVVVAKLNNLDTVEDVIFQSPLLG